MSKSRFGRLPAALVALNLTLLLSACAMMQQELEEPTFRMTGVEPLSLGLGEQQWRLTMRIDNPNNVSLPVRGLNYKLMLADIDFASGRKTDGFTVAANDTTTLTLDVTTHLIQTLPRLAELVDSRDPRISYQLSGDVEYGRFFRGRREFEQTGQLRFQ